MTAMRDGIIALDFGGTKLAAGIADRDGQWVDVQRRPTPADAHTSIDVMRDMISGMVREHHMTPGAIGVSFGGHVDTTTGVVRRSMQVPGWDNVPLGRILSEAFNAPTTIYDDATGGAIGEWAAGAGKGLSDLAYITISTGVGGGLILNGEPYEGATGFAGEFGHLPVQNASGLCTCGLRGCLESEASGPAIARKAQALLDRGERSILRSDGATVTAEAVSFAAARDDAVAVRVLEDAGRAIGLFVSILVIALEVQAVIIGGGVAHAAEPLWTSLRDAVVAPLRMDRWVRVGPAKHIDEAPLYGARAVALEIAHGGGAGGGS
jgi:glucokinase